MINKVSIEVRRAAQQAMELAAGKPGEFCPAAFYMFDLLCQGNEGAARDLAEIALRQGRASPQVQRLVADMLASEKQTAGAGRKTHLRPTRWMDLGARYNQLTDSDLPPSKRLTRTKAIGTIEKECGVSKSVVERAVRFYGDVTKDLGLQP